MELRQLRYFVTVADLQNFTRAAAAVRIAQPALSRQVRKLESELGVVLFSRDGRSALLTDAGKKFYDHARGVLREIEEAKQNLLEEEKSPSGTVGFGFPPHVGPAFAASLVGRFQEQLPRAHLRIVEGFSNQLADWLFTGRLDAALLYNAGHYKHLRTEFTVNEDICLIAPPADQNTSNGQIPFSRLAGLPFIVPDQPSNTRYRIEQTMADTGIALNLSLEVDSLATIKRLVAAGRGYALLTFVTVHEEVAEKKLSAAKVVKPVLRIPLNLALPFYGKMRMLVHTLVSLVWREVDSAAAEGLWSSPVK